MFCLNNSKKKRIITNIIHSIYCSMAVMLWILYGCDTPSSGASPEVYNGNSKYTIREKSLSVDGNHEISTFVTNNSGIGVVVDGEFKYYDDYAIRFCPVISENGQYAWAQQLKGSGYDIIWQNKSILHSGAVSIAMNSKI